MEDQNGEMSTLGMKREMTLMMRRVIHHLFLQLILATLRVLFALQARRGHKMQRVSLPKPP